MLAAASRSNSTSPSLRRCTVRASPSAAGGRPCWGLRGDLADESLRTRHGRSWSVPMTGPRVSIVNYTLSMMRGGGETRDLAFATHLRDLGCEVTLISVDPLLGRVRHPIQGVPSR